MLTGLPHLAGPRPALAASEFALILPLLVTFILGCIDFGRFASTQIAVTSAAEAGALVGALEPYTPANESVWAAAVRSAAQQDMAALADFDPAQLNVAVTPSGTGDDWAAQVTVSYPFRVLIPWPGIPSQMNLSQSVVLRTIRP